MHDTMYKCYIKFKDCKNCKEYTDDMAEWCKNCKMSKNDYCKKMEESV